MSENKMRSKDEILQTLCGLTNMEDATRLNGFASTESLLDIRDILNERMPKYLEISGTKEKTTRHGLLEYKFWKINFKKRCERLREERIIAEGIDDDILEGIVKKKEKSE